MKDAAPYGTLTKHYLAGRTAKFVETMTANEAAFAEDGTLGLVRQMQTRLPARVVSTQPATFVAQPLAAVAAAAKLPDAAAAAALIASCALYPLLCACRAGARGRRKAARRGGGRGAHRAVRSLPPALCLSLAGSPPPRRPPPRVSRRALFTPCFVHVCLRHACRPLAPPEFLPRTANTDRRGGRPNVTGAMISVRRKTLPWGCSAEWWTPASSQRC